MADLGNLHFGVHLKDYTDAEADKIKSKLENLTVKLNIDGNNVNVSNTDLIKKQIEDAVKSVSVQSVNIDANDIKTQVSGAFQGLSPQVNVTLLKGTLSNDLQAYFDTKSFKVSISITKSQVKSELDTAFANINIPVTVKVSASAAIKQLKDSLNGKNIPIGVRAKNINDFVKDLNTRLGNKSVKIGVLPNQKALLKSVKQALQGTAIKAQVDVNVDASAITRAVQSAINNASFTYHPNGGKRPSGGGGSNGRNWSSNASHGLYESARASVSLGRSLSTNIRIAGELGTALGNLASIFRIKDILAGVVQIGGQLEQQKIALGAILQDGGKATEMFDKIQSLAVKSPFGIMDLNQYTKQLSAYGIEYNELYDTMKRLADISAGVGVDMGRIILAYGQVRAAGFLKGTELRQFTEANIPLVDKLAERFTKLSGEMVTASDVYDMISKKKVSFEDVKSVLWDLTDSGGMFHNMQEVLSDSLVAKWENLGDAIDVMYSKIAEGATGNGLKALAELLTELTKQWDKFGVAISTVGSMMLIRKATVHAFTKTLSSVKGATVAYQRALIDMRNKTRRELAATSNSFDRFIIHAAGGLRKLEVSIKAFAKNFSVVWKSITATLKSAAMSFLPFAVITGITETIYYFMNKSEESSNRIKEASKAASEGYDNLSAKIKNLGKEIPKTTSGILSSIDDMENALRDYAPNSGDILNNINKRDKNGKFERSDEERYRMLKQALDDTREAYKLLNNEMEGFTETANKATDGWRDESFIDNLKDASNEMNNYRSKLNIVASEGKKYEEAIKKAASSDEGYAKAIEGKTLKESLALLKDYSKALQTFTNETSNVNSKTAVAFVDSIHDLQEAQEIAFEDSKTFVEKYKKLLTSTGFDLNNLTQPQKIAISVDITRFLNSIDSLDDETKKLITERILEKEFKITLSKEDKKEVETIANPYDASKDEVAKMWKKRAEEIEKAVKMYDQWKKVEGTVNAASRVKGNKELSSLFNGAYGFNLDLENPTEAYKYIRSKLNESLEAQKELKIQLGVKISDAELKDAQDALKASLEEIKKETNKIIEGWDLYDKLFEATGNKKISMNIAFGGSVAFGSKLEQLQHEIEEKMSKLGIGIKFEDLIKMDTKSLEEGGYGALTGIIETYNKEATKVKEESVKNFIEIINKSKDFSQQIVDIEREFQKNLEDLRKNADDYTPEELNKAEMKLREEADKRIVKVQFEEFKESSDWVKVFDDLDRVSNATLENMIKNIEEFAKQANLSEEVTKQLVEAMAKLREEAIDRNPFEGFKDAWNRLKELRDYTKNATLVAGGNVYRTGSGTADDPYQFKSKKEVDDNISEATDELNDAALKIADKFEAVADAIDLVSGMFENLGVDMSGFMGTLVDVLHGTVSGAKTGSELSKSLGIGGAWGAAAGAAIGAISSIAASHDKKLDAAIDKSKLKVKELGNAYERLEGIIEWQLGGATDKQATEMLDNLNNQVYELYRQRELEEKKKKTDPSKIEDYNKQIHEAEIAVRDFYANLANEQYGVDIKNWASDIASALTDAFASGEDAAQAFDNTVGGILKSLATEAIRMQFIEPAMNNLRSFLFDSKGGIFTKNSLGGTQLTELEAGRLAAELDKLKEQIGAANEYWNAINEATGGILDDTEGMAKGGLSKDIQGVTEDTANLLGSYLNSIRQSVHVKQQLIEKLVVDDIPKINYLAEAQLRELGQITANTKRNADAADKIYDLVSRVVDRGSNKLKV